MLPLSRLTLIACALIELNTGSHVPDSKSTFSLRGVKPETMSEMMRMILNVNHLAGYSKVKVKDLPDASGFVPISRRRHGIEDGEYGLEEYDYSFVLGEPEMNRIAKSSKEITLINNRFKDTRDGINNLLKEPYESATKINRTECVKVLESLKNSLSKVVESSLSEGLMSRLPATWLAIFKGVPTITVMTEVLEENPDYSVSFSELKPILADRILRDIENLIREIEVLMIGDPDHDVFPAYWASRSSKRTVELMELQFWLNARLMANLKLAKRQFYNIGANTSAIYAPPHVESVPLNRLTADNPFFNGLNIERFEDLMSNIVQADYIAMESNTEAKPFAVDDEAFKVEPTYRDLDGGFPALLFTDKGSGKKMIIRKITKGNGDRSYLAAGLRYPHVIENYAVYHQGMDVTKPHHYGETPKPDAFWILEEYLPYSHPQPKVYDPSMKLVVESILKGLRFLDNSNVIGADTNYFSIKGKDAEDEHGKKYIQYKITNLYKIEFRSRLLKRRRQFYKARQVQVADEVRHYFQNFYAIVGPEFLATHRPLERLVKYGLTSGVGTKYFDLTKLDMLSYSEYFGENSIMSEDESVDFLIKSASY